MCINHTSKKPYIITISCTKGGSAKSTNAANIGAFCADHGLRTLLIDTDTQPTLSSYYSLAETAPGGIHEFLSLRDVEPSHIISKTAIKNLDLIQSNDPSNNVSQMLRNAPDGVIRFSHLIKSIKNYDVIVVDTRGTRDQTANATSYPTQAQYITVTLDKLRPYEHNPRKTRNPNFEMIKESIRRRGLDHKPNITQRPGEPYYIIADGGNTRIQALKELFTETQDQRFWSIECLYKPWKGDSADSVEAELDLLIGHLIENDTRADLSFIEKALGIQQAKEYYEKKLGTELSSRELSTELEKDGYIIHQTNISKMERRVIFLYPYIPDVLFNGLGHTPIDKLLAIRNNALSVWQNYQFNTDIQFDDIWQNSLSRCNEDNPFNIKDFQHNLINEMMDILEDSENSPTYELLYLEIDLDEQRFKKLAQKQQEITASVDQSLQDIADFNQPSSIPEQVIPTSKPLAPSQASGLHKHNSEHAVSTTMTTESVTKEEDNTTDNTEDWLTQT